ncbi:Transposase and inactivated derivatives, IS30 family, partial [Dysosmobacter welbionis]
LLLLQALDAHDPAIHDLGALASALDQVGDALLILGNLPADRPIEGGSHLLALFGVVYNINAVDLQRITVGTLEPVMLLQHLHKVLKHLQSGGKVPGNEKEMPPAYFDGLHRVHI